MNAQPEPGATHMIELGADTYTASLSLDLDGTVRILGDGASTTTLNGGGIRNAGTVTLDQVVVSDSHASD